MTSHSQMTLYLSVADSTTLRAVATAAQAQLQLMINQCLSCAVSLSRYTCMAQSSRAAFQLLVCVCADWSDDIQVVAVGKCNHKEICAECILQMVMLYQNSQCPLCKGELDQVLSIVCFLVLQCAFNISLCLSSAARLVCASCLYYSIHADLQTALRFQVCQHSCQIAG